MQELSNFLAQRNILDPRKKSEDKLQSLCYLAAVITRYPSSCVQKEIWLPCLVYSQHLETKLWDVFFAPPCMYSFLIQWYD